MCIRDRGKFVLIDSGTFIVEIVPDKSSLLPGLRKGIICQQFPVFILRVQVKYKYPSGAVSYTHLDVYKRQVILSLIFSNAAFLIPYTFIISSMDLNPPNASR